MQQKDRAARRRKRRETVLEPGYRAPSFHLLDQRGKPVRLSDFAGRRLMLYFFPKANTPGCTAQACAVRDNLTSLHQRGMAVVGISPDKSETLRQFDLKHELGFPLLSDRDHIAAQAYGAWGRKSMYGRKYMGIIRSVFIIDERGLILNVWYKINPGNTANEVLKFVDARAS